MGVFWRCWSMLTNFWSCMENMIIMITGKFQVFKASESKNIVILLKCRCNFWHCELSLCMRAIWLACAILMKLSNIVSTVRKTSCAKFEPSRSKLTAVWENLLWRFLWNLSHFVWQVPEILAQSQQFFQSQLIIF
jgi:hypothetical protein